MIDDAEIIIVAGKLRQYTAYGMKCKIERTTMATEDAVGIKQYTHPELAGVSGILKQRYSDFIVREVTKEGQVVFLESIDGDALQKKWFGNVSQGDESKEKAVIPNDQDIGEAIQKDISAFYVDKADHPSNWQSLKDFLNSSKNKVPDGPKEWIGFPCDEKTIRSQLHQVFKKYGAGWLDSSTIQQPPSTSSFIKLYAVSQGNKNPRKRKFDSEENKWPKDCGDYLQFTLLKENIDTMQAVQVISKQLRMKSSEHIYYNGTKDKRGITTQKITMYRRKPSEFKRFLSFYKPLLRLGDYAYVKEPCKLGALAGNRFEIILRDIQYTSEEAITALCAGLAADGFINYFGLQRFGKGGSKSHEIGCSIFQSNWKKCITSLFTPNAHDKEELKQAKVLFGQQKYAEAYAIMPYNLYAEKQVLKHLQHAPEDYCAAFGSMNKFMRLICAHAYQSYLWNHAACLRIATYGLQVVVGDLVLVGSQGLEEQEIAGLDEELVEGAEEDVMLSDPSLANAGKITAEEPQDTSNVEQTVHIVTEEDIASHRYTMKDVVLPLIGFAVLFPAHSIATVYEELMRQDGLTMKHFQSCLPMYRMKGNYRKVMQYAGALEWKVLTYTNPQAELADTELASFRQIAVPAKKRHNAENTSSVTENTSDVVAEEGSSSEMKEESKAVEKVVVEEEAAPAAVVEVVAEKELKALQLKFTLPPGSYATMLLREITKESTETEYHLQLTSSATTNTSAIATVASTDAVTTSE